MEDAARTFGGAQRGGDVAGDDEDRGTGDDGLAEGGEGIDRARAGGRDGDPEPARSAGVAVGGVRRGLLVTHADDPGRGLRGPEGEDVDAGQPEGDIDVLRCEELQDRRGDVHPPPRWPPDSRDFTRIFAVRGRQAKGVAAVRGLLAGRE